MEYLLDTDHMTFLQRQDGSEWQAIMRNINRVGQSIIAVSIVSYHEQVNGIEKKINQAKSPFELPRWYHRMVEMFELYSNMNLADFDDLAAAKLDHLRKVEKVRIKPMDLRIASIALANDLTLVARNHSVFAKVPGLKIEDWTK